MASTRICSIEGCDKTHRARGWCLRHWDKWRKHGDPLGGRDYAIAQKFYNDVVLPYDGDECLIWQYSRTSKGYGHLSVVGRSGIVSRMLCEDVNGPPPEADFDAAHSCGRGHQGCVTKRHISWKTKTENQADRLGHGTMTRGEKHPGARLSEDDVRAIRALRGSMVQREIGELFGVERKTISDIFWGKTWGWMS